mgnify:CR=1 FL=1
MATLNELMVEITYLKQGQAEIKTLLEKFDNVLFCEENGMILKVDRLEQQEQTRKWHIRLLWTAIVTASSALIVKMLEHK